MTGNSWTGGCQCGAIRYEVDPAQTLTLYCCHCTECQRQSASAFGMSLRVAAEGFRVVQGAPAGWQRPTDSGGINRAHFCPDCGTRLWHDGGPDSDQISLKAGSLDDANHLRPVGHIWTRSAQAWVLPLLPKDLLLYEVQPESDDALYAAWKRQRAAA